LVLTLVVVFAVGMLVPQAGARETVTPEVTLEEAIVAALKNNESVKKAGLEVDRTEELRNYRGDQLTYAPTGPPGSALVEVPWSNLLLADLTWRMSKKSLTAGQDGVVLDTCNKYWNVLQAQEKVKAAEVALASAERQLKAARALYSVGLNTRTGLTAAEAQQRSAAAGLASAKNDLESAFDVINRAIGLWPDDRPVLTDTVEFTPLDINDLDREVRKVLDSAPTVWLAQEKVTLQKYLEDMMFYTGEYRPYQARKIEVEQAELDAASTRKLFDQITRSLYYGAKSIEEAYAGAQEGLKVAEENLRVAQVKQKVGMVTTTDVLVAEKAVAEAHSALLQLACQHAYTKLAFAKPWAYLSGLSQSSSSGS
jgi:outer membrane protein TolC